MKIAEIAEKYPESKFYSNLVAEKLNLIYSIDPKLGTSPKINAFNSSQSSQNTRSGGIHITNEYNTNEMSLNKIGTALVFISMMAISISLIILALISH